MIKELVDNDYITYCPRCGRLERTYYDADYFYSEKSFCLECDPYKIPFTKKHKNAKMIHTTHTLSEWVDGKPEARDAFGFPLRVYQYFWDNYIDIPTNEKLDRKAFETFKAKIIPFLEDGGYGGTPTYTCPKCGYKTIAPAIRPQGFGVGKAVAGVAVAGPIGAAAGAIGMNKEKRVCPNCGHKW